MNYNSSQKNNSDCYNIDHHLITNEQIFNIAKIGSDETTSKKLEDIRNFAEPFLQYYVEGLDTTIGSKDFFFSWLQENQNIREDEILNEEKLTLHNIDKEKYVIFPRFV